MNEGKWYWVDQDEGDVGQSQYWEYYRGAFERISDFFKRRSGKMKIPKIETITAQLDYNFPSYQEDEVKIQIVLGNPITIERDRGFGAIDYYDSFDTINVVSEKPFNTFKVETIVRNKKNSENMDDTELKNLIKKMLDELKPELQKYIK